MELRDGGRGLVQIKDDGTYAILPVAAHSRCGTAHARMPVMLLRHSNGKMRRDGSNAASMQPNTAVASAEDCKAHWDSAVTKSIVL